MDDLVSWAAHEPPGCLKACVSAVATPVAISVATSGGSWRARPTAGSTAGPDAGSTPASTPRLPERGRALPVLPMSGAPAVPNEATSTPSSTGPGPIRSGGRSAERLAAGATALGAETDTARAVKRIVPWILSGAIHGVLAILGFLVTWTVVLLQSDEQPARIIADFNAMTYQPLVRMSQDDASLADLRVQDRVEVADPVPQVDRVDDPVELDPLVLFSGATSESSFARFAPDPTRTTATFVGLSSTNARRIVYVIDASGSMIRSLPIVLEELARSLDGLAPPQEFTVIFFSRNEAIIVPPVDRLSRATEAEKIRVLSWIGRHVIPAGRSNPLNAIEKALGFRPDVIFLLSENITGSGEFEIDQRDLLALLDELNPVDPELGRRATQINCVQFLDPDPLDTLREIARRHGGEKGYKFLDREELGLKAP